MELSRVNELRILISSMVGVVGKDGYFLGSNIISGFDEEYLYNALLQWETTDKSEFDSRLRAALGEDWDYIKNSTFEIFPNRVEILKCIFDLYERENYIALIPLALSQIDGIVKEMTKGYSGLYQVKNGAPKFLSTQLYVDFVSNAVQLDIDDRNKCELFEANVSDFGKFNRHAILHGESTKYASERNAVKAIALLQFISELYNANNY